MLCLSAIKKSFAKRKPLVKKVLVFPVVLDPLERIGMQLRKGRNENHLAKIR
jgi:hypothetical protein